MPCTSDSTGTECSLLDGKICVITGGGSGVGRAAAVLFAEHGASIVVGDVRDEWVGDTVGLVDDVGGTAVAVHCDVSTESDVEALVRACRIRVRAARRHVPRTPPVRSSRSTAGTSRDERRRASGVSIPETLEDATSTVWLSEVLESVVTAVSVGDVDNRVSTNAPIRVELADGRTRHLWVKGYFSEIGRTFRFAGVPEAMFYRELAGPSGIRTLRSVFAAVDPITQSNVVLTEDVALEGAVFLDSLSDYSVDQAAQSLEQLATLHTTTWLDPACRNAAWLESRLHTYTMSRGVAEIRANFAGPLGDGVPDAVRDAQRLYDAYKVVAADVATATPWCVIHGDPHIGNVFLDRDGHPSFVDWQLVQRGPWYLDVGYHLASVLSVEDRRRSEQDLVRHYLDRVKSSGIEVPDTDAVWRGLQRGMVHGFYLWGITLKVDPRKTAVLLERLGAAVDDHDAFKEIGR